MIRHSQRLRFSRASAAFLRGFSEVRVYWKEDELDRDAYEICVRWCEKDGICTIGDLKDRVVSQHRYEALWLRRCEDMPQGLVAKRRQHAVE